MRPGAKAEVGTSKGFLGADEKLLDILAADNDYVVGELVGRRPGARAVISTTSARSASGSSPGNATVRSSSIAAGVSK